MSAKHDDSIAESDRRGASISGRHVPCIRSSMLRLRRAEKISHSCDQQVAPRLLAGALHANVAVALATCRVHDIMSTTETPLCPDRPVGSVI